MKNLIQELEKRIIYHKEKYYSGKPEISDEEFDKIENELRSLDPENPILKLVGTPIKSEDSKIKHDKKMLSLEKTYDLEDLGRWISDYDVLSIFKIDGSSCSLIYENGHLIIGKTRGDGDFGENVTSKIMYIESIPKKIEFNERLEIRGEVFCNEENFYNLSQEMKGLNLSPPNSQRNIVAGLLGRKENIQLCRFLNFKAFDIMIENRIKFESEKFELLKKLGFETLEFYLHKNRDGLSARIEDAKNFMAEGDYLIDGLVFIYNDLSIHEELGETAHHPRYKIAFKFPGDTKKTKIQSIEWGVSRNGVLTPVAQVVPVELSGAMISRVTLHNLGIVKSFQLKTGDEIEIIRSGEVIPKFLSVIESSHSNFVVPKKCPSCCSDLYEENIRLICKNENCQEKIKGRILNFVEKAGIDDISEKRIEEMMRVGLVKDIPDLFVLFKENFFLLEKVKDKLAQKMYVNIQKAKNIPLIKFLNAVGIEGLSTNKIEKIVCHGFNSLDKFLQLTEFDLLNIEGFAEKSTADILKSLNSKKNLISNLIDVGVVVENFNLEKSSEILAGKKICITGELGQGRSTIENIIKKNGGVVVSSVSKNTTYLLTNETNSNSSKFIKAKSLDIQIISEADFYRMIEEK
jgi:DNA ligase (NAD+)